MELKKKILTADQKMEMRAVCWIDTSLKFTSFKTHPI
jgi:hypothetical protein